MYIKNVLIFIKKNNMKTGTILNLNKDFLITFKLRFFINFSFTKFSQEVKRKYII